MQENIQKNYGKFGNIRKDYLKRWHPEQYHAMVKSGTLEKHLAECDKAAQRWVNHFFENSLRRCPCPAEPTDAISWIHNMNDAIRDMEQMAIGQFIQGD